MGTLLPPEEKAELICNKGEKIIEKHNVLTVYYQKFKISFPNMYNGQFTIHGSLLCAHTYLYGHAGETSFSLAPLGNV